MAFSQSDAVTQTMVRDRVHEIAEEMLVFRRAFEQMAVPAGTGNQWQVPTDDDVLGEPSEIQPGGAYPTDEESWTTVTFTRRKFGQAIPVHDEAEMDNVFPLIRRLVDKQGRKMAEKLNREAHAVLDANLNTSSPVGDNGGALTYDEILTGKKTLRASGYNPDLVILQEDAEEDLLTDSDFTRSTSKGDSVVHEGVIGRISGMDVIVSNAGLMAAADALLIDTRFYGGEAVWVDMELEQVDERLQDTTYLKVRTFRDWQALDAQSAIKVQG